MNLPENFQRKLWKPAIILIAVAFLFAPIIGNLVRDWWSDENYSHGLLVPFVIALIVYFEFDELKKAFTDSGMLIGGLIIFFGILTLLFGTLGAELFAQRIALGIVLAGTTVFFFGTRILKLLVVPFLLLLFSIPIPQIIFNKIAFPLQIFASRLAVFGISLFEIPTVRKGNVIELLPRGATQIVNLEVVEACSGIRSLMTLAALALILAYFTRTKKTDANSSWRNVLLSRDSLRALILVLSAVPIAVITNAGRVAATAIATFYYGRQFADGISHSFSGWLVYLIALAMVFALNKFLLGVLRDKDSFPTAIADMQLAISITSQKILALALCFALSGIAINWIARRGEAPVERKNLRELSPSIGDWKQQGTEIRFSESTEKILRTTDYVMRDYVSPEGIWANLYVGYYKTQRTGETYHSPQNCLPGAGWEMVDPARVTIENSAGESFEGNRFIIQKGDRREILIYWYQGRGRKTASEFEDKFYTVVDSLTRGRSDGAMVRIITPIGNSIEESEKAAKLLSGQLSSQLDSFIPE